MSSPSIKQVEFIKKLAQRYELAVPDYNQMSLDDAKAWISDTLAKNGQPPKPREPEPVKESFPVERPYDKAEAPKEFHLSIEEVRCRALEIVQNGMERKMELPEFLKEAQTIENWILR